MKFKIKDRAANIIQVDTHIAIVIYSTKTFNILKTYLLFIDDEGHKKCKSYTGLLRYAKSNHKTHAQIADYNQQLYYLKHHPQDKDLITSTTPCLAPAVPSDDGGGAYSAPDDVVTHSSGATLFTFDDFPLNADMIGDLFILLNSELESDDDFFDTQRLLLIKQALVFIDNKLHSFNLSFDNPKDDYPDWVW